MLLGRLRSDLRCESLLSMPSRTASSRLWNRRRFVAHTALALLGLSCSKGQNRASLLVASAMSLREVMSRIKAALEAEDSTLDVVLNLAGSQALAAQILAGAAADVFISANAVQLQRLVDAGLASEPRPIASNRLVAIAALGSGLLEPQDLGRKGLKVVLASPEVPVGAYSREALARLGIEEPVLKNLVSEEENVRAVMHKVSLGEADAGIVYATDVRNAAPDSVLTIELPGAEEIRATYLASAVQGGPEPLRALAFLDHLQSAQAQAIFAQAGFGAP